MRAALVVHDDVLRVSIEKHDGFLFSTPATASVPRSGPRSPLSTLQWPRSRHCNCPCAWGW